MRGVIDLGPLRHRRFALLWTGAFVSNIGTWMETIGVGILVTDRTGQAGWTAIVAVAGFVPAGLLAPVGGLLADRLPRRALLITTTLVQTAFATLLALLALADATSPGVVTLIVFGSGLAGGIGFPAYVAIMPDLVPRSELPAATALNSAQYNLGRVIGPALAGIVIGLGDYSLAFAINAASFFAVLAVLLPLELPPPPSTRTNVREGLREGARYVAGTRPLRIAASFFAANLFFCAPFIALVPAMAINVFHDESFGTALLVTAQGVGAVTMAILLGGLHRRFGTGRFLFAALTALPVALVAYALAPTLGLAAAGLFVVGACYLATLASFMTTAQLWAPADRRGRVVSIFMMLLGLVYPVGAIAQGALADRVGSDTGVRVTIAAGALVMLAIVLGTRALRPSLLHVLDHVPDPDDTTEARGAPPPVQELLD